MRVLIALLAYLYPVISQGEDLVFSNSAVVPNDKPYYIEKKPDVEIIYTKDNKSVAEYALGFEKKLIPLYNQQFGYSMDSKLSVGLISDQNQIANGFSTQYPNNRQVNYMGGAQSIDYFASPSWLDTLLLHETAHNYQTNAKAHPITQGVNAVVRNGYFLFPIFATPNAFESSFILEGNAVLNESWHGKGGRLYSGRYRAMYHAHAQAGYLSKARLYNNTLNFPYGEGHYIFGGFYQYYLAEQYGLNRTNQYFWQRSKTWYFPFTVNSPSRRTFAQDFNTLFSDWKLLSEKRSQDFQTVQGKVLGRSQFYSQLSKSQNDILFIGNETGTDKPTLYRYQTQTTALDMQPTLLNQGRLFHIGNTTYSVASKHIRPSKISQGLFDDQGELLKGTSGKVVQGILSDGTLIYFNSSESYQSPKLYVGNESYDEIHSSVLVHNDELYYFKQKDDQRILYKNKQALLAFPGFYSIVSDIDKQGRIYFIANTKLGSGLYRYGKNGIEKVLAADNILSAKLINPNQVLVTALSADDYYFSITDIKPIKQSPFIVEYFWDSAKNSDSMAKSTVSEIEPDVIQHDTSYAFGNSIKYAAGTLITQKDDENNTLFSAAFTFSDPLTYHNLTLFAQKDADLTTRAGVSYANNQHLLMYGAKAYGVIENGLEEAEAINPDFKTRDYGLGIDVKLPLFKRGFWDISTQAGYFQDYKNIEREPLSLTINAQNVKAFGTSMYINEGSNTQLYTVHDREQNVIGGQLTLYASGPWQTYANTHIKHSQYDGTSSAFFREGIVLSKDMDFFGNDPSGFIMPSLYEESLAEAASKFEINIAKVFDTSAYGFWFPVSLRRQAVTLSYRYYDLKSVHRFVSNLGFANFGDVQIGQTAAGIELDTLFFHKLSIRIKLEAIFNDDERITEKQRTQLSVTVPF